ncbi:hypothetical protein C8J57DRAFT_1362496 [Mycena rebaudengoi]|nr:hypothetical protein C8J57DRAFT_1362496 [Mycena rebaudengoi]
MFFQSRLLPLVALALMMGPSFAEIIAQCSLSGVVGDCSKFVADFCNSLDHPISPFGSASRCYNGPGNAYKCDFTVLSPLSTAPTPNEVNCNTALNTVSRSCSMGGQGQVVGGFLFAVDPNNGTCGLTCGD